MKLPCMRLILERCPIFFCTKCLIFEMFNFDCLAVFQIFCFIPNLRLWYQWRERSSPALVAKSTFFSTKICCHRRSHISDFWPFFETSGFTWKLAPQISDFKLNWKNILCAVFLYKRLGPIFIREMMVFGKNNITTKQKVQTKASHNQGSPSFPQNEVRSYTPTPRVRFGGNLPPLT